MNQLTQEQIKTLEDAFASYPEDFEPSSDYASMKGIEKQIKDLKGKSGNIFYVSKVNMGEDNHMHFVMDKMKVGETK